VAARLLIRALALASVIAAACASPVTTVPTTADATTPTRTAAAASNPAQPFGSASPAALPFFLSSSSPAQASVPPTQTPATSPSPGASPAAASPAAETRGPATTVPAIPAPVSATTPAPTAAPAPATRPPSVVDLTRLPLGDGKRSTSAQIGWVWSCTSQLGGGGAQRQGPWIHGATWDLTSKITVDGDVRWQQQLQVTISGTDRLITGNGLPSHGTGVYPVQRADDAYAWDPNPNRITPQNISYRMPAIPRLNAAPQCAGGTVGFALAGGAIFNAFDAQSKDAVANEIQDSCGGHPERTGQYHYHGIPRCFADTASGHSALFGYAFDGFGIFGPRDVDGRTLANVDLDECHGHAHEIEWDGVKRVMFHYHFTYEFPYSVSCYRGQPIRVGP
jgi:hypothetical protein